MLSPGRGAQRALAAAAWVALVVVGLARPVAAGASGPGSSPPALAGADSTGPAPADSSPARAPAPLAPGFWARGPEEGGPWRADRLQHFSLSATLVLGAEAGGARDLGAALPAAALGLGKELVDARRGRGASRWDLAADALGIAAGLLTARLLR